MEPAEITSCVSRPEDADICESVISFSKNDFYVHEYPYTGRGLLPDLEMKACIQKGYWGALSGPTSVGE